MELEISRRTLMTASALAGGLALASAEPALAIQQSAAAADGPYVLPPLPYDYAELEPHISAAIMKLHHSVHHSGYVKGANEALGQLENARRIGGDEIFRIRAITDALAFNLAGHVLHSIFWTNMIKDGGGDPPPEAEIAKLIQRDFGSNAAFRAHFSAAAAQAQGGGWAILAYDPLAQRLIVLQVEKHQVNLVPLAVPLLVLDVWEHAYYLQYQNVRTNYIKAFFNVVNWANVDQRLAAARKLTA
jgi:Fe-Mn family superoxide dismutase